MEVKLLYLWLDDYIQFTKTMLDPKKINSIRRKCIEANPEIKITQKLGSPDIVCVADGRYVGIEVKAARGRQRTTRTNFRRI
jgi:hypothetical protein